MAYKYNVPTLKDYSGAIQANNSMSQAFANMSKSANDWMGQKERERTNKANELHKNNSLAKETKQNEISNIQKAKDYGFKLNEYQSKQKELSYKKEANTEALKVVNPKLYSNIGAKFGDVPSIENASKMNDVTGHVDLSKVKQKAPTYKLERTDKGYAMFNTLDPTAEPVPIGGYKPYVKPTASSNGVSSGRKTNEYLNWFMVNQGRKKKGLEGITFDDFYNQKMNTKTMGVGLRDAKSVEQETGRVAKILNLNSFEMSSYDFSKLQPQQRYEMDNLINTREQGLKAKVPDWMKKNLDNLSAVVYSAGEVSKNINSKDTGIIDASFNKINQYLGMGDVGEVAKRSLTQSNYQLYSNFMLKSMSGLAVTAPEEARFTKAFGSLMLNDNVTAVKIKTNMENLAYRLENMKKSYDPIAFNYRYGHLQKGVNNAVSKMKHTLKKETDSSNSYVQADGSNFQDKKAEEKTIVQTLRNKKTGEIMNVYSDGSKSYE